MEPTLAALFDRQHGVATSAQIIAAVGRRRSVTLRDRGAISRVIPGVYCVGEVTLAARLRGLDLSCGAPVPACLGTAAYLHGFDTEDTADVHVLTPPGHQLRHSDGIVVHRRDGAPLTVVDGRPVTAPAWTAVEVARGLRRPRALATLDAALRSGTCARPDLRAAATAQAGRRGIVAVRDLLLIADPLAESPMESVARLRMIDGGLPAPVLQYVVVDPRGRRWRLDFAWPAQRVAAEYDGEAWHSGVEAMRRDRARHAALLDAGWTVVPVIADDLRGAGEDIVARIGALLSRARSA